MAVKTKARQSVTVLGSTGSVGVNTLRVVRAHADRFEVRALAARSRTEMLLPQIEAFRPKAVYLDDERAAMSVRQECGSKLRVFDRADGLDAFVAYADSDILVAGTSGTGSLRPVLGALNRGRRVALANKEILVAAGNLVMAALRKNPSASLIPVDSEHNAIFQCLQGGSAESVHSLILTGSGGPLRKIPEARFKRISKERVVKHPKWRMGRKISVDSATLMNKGLELIEASWLFGLPVRQIRVLIHPEAVVHSMVEFRDGSVLAHLGATDMRLPIQHALFFPERARNGALRLDWKSLSRLTFSPPDRKKFPCLDIAAQAARDSGSAPCVLSAADEVAVGAYLEDRIPFLRIPHVIEKVLAGHRHIADPGLSEIESVQTWATEEANRLCGVGAP